jgi:RNA polymerase sigma factor (sigma-70 family)
VLGVVHADEAGLLRRAKRGDLAAYRALIEMHEGIAFRTAYVIAQNEADAADAVQEAFARAYRALGRFRNGAPFRPWFLRIVVNEARDRRDASGRFAALVARAAAADRIPEPAPSAEAVVVARELRDEVVAALARLRERDRLVIVLRYFLDLSEEDLAGALDCPRGTVKSRLSRAMDALRGELEGLE